MSQSVGQSAWICKGVVIDAHIPRENESGSSWPYRFSGIGAFPEISPNKTDP